MSLLPRTTSNELGIVVSIPSSRSSCVLVSTLPRQYTGSPAANTQTVHLQRLLSQQYSSSPNSTLSQELGSTSIPPVPSCRMNSVPPESVLLVSQLHDSSPSESFVQTYSSSFHLYLTTPSTFRQSLPPTSTDRVP